MMEPTRRFSNRVDAYVAGRPGYPPALLHFMQRSLSLVPRSVVADIGAGTGLLAKLFLDNGNEVIGIEPNKEMREAGVRYLESAAKYTAIDARAEDTGLSDRSVDYVVAGQAFHWFEASAASNEFRRILKPSGWCLIVWNERLYEASPFMVAYEDLVSRFENDRESQTASRESAQNSLTILFSGDFRIKTFPNPQVLDQQGLIDRFASSSYMPAIGTEAYPKMLSAAAALFEKFQEDGRVVIEHETRAFYGQLR